MLLFFLPLARGQEALNNGALQVGSLSSGSDTDSWTFSANAGDSIFVRVGSTNFTPRIRLFDPNNALAAETTSGNSITRDGFLTVQATNSGTYSVLVSPTFPTQSGTYALHLAVALREFQTSSGDQGGDLPNGTVQKGDLTLGDLDLWRFSANAGDGLMIRVGSVDFTPWIRIYGPDGALVQEQLSGNSITRDGFITLSATNTGTYLAVVSARFAGQAGTYELHLASTPQPFATGSGDEGGTLTNGVSQSAVLSLGDLDLWSFSANAEASINVRVGSTNFTPWIRLYNPFGQLIADEPAGNSITRDGFVSLHATNSGTFLAVVSAAFPGQSGSYQVTFASAPGKFLVGPRDEGGALSNGALQSGKITLGDFDLWSFTAEQGDGIMVRVGSTNFTPWIRLFGPDGSLVQEQLSGNSITRDGTITLSTTNAGVYQIVLGARFAGQDGPYALHILRAPEEFLVSEGDQGGTLTNGFRHSGKIDLGDIDLWSFYGTPGDSNVLRIESVDFTPWIRLYSPGGALLKETTSGNSITRNGSVSLEITNSGNYTVAVSATYPGQSGTYTFKQSRVAPDLIMPEKVTIQESTPLNASISAQDPDEPVKPLSFALLSSPPGFGLTLASATNATLAWMTTEADGPSTNTIIATVTDVVNGRSFIRTNSFTLIVEELNAAPQLTLPTEQTIDEQTTLNISASATDSDLPPNQLRFALTSAPSGMTINTNTGAISWTPSEEQGPSTNLVQVVVTDYNPWASNEQQISVTNSFTVVVREVNLPPLLTAPVNQTLDEMTALSAAASASDPDLPANQLIFSLSNAPEGMAINPSTGAITWTPSEAQGPSTNLITVRIEDSGSPMGATTATFTVIVTDVNSAPVLPNQINLAIHELVTLMVTNTATDPDLPAHTLSYHLIAAPTNAVISANGIISWTPTEAEGPSTNQFVTVVTDNGSPGLSTTNTFTIIVNEVNTAPELQTVSDTSLHFGTPLSIQLVASDKDLPANQLTFSLDQAPTNMTINATSGLISWIPAQSQLGTFPVTVRVTDNATSSLSATNTFNVSVTGEGVRLEIHRLASGLMQITINGDTGNEYEIQKCLNFDTWEKLLQFQLINSPYSYIDPESTTNVVRFYRLKLVE